VGASAVTAPENAALRVVVVKLGAKDILQSLSGHVYLRCCEHAEERRGEVDPERRPHLGVHGRAHGASGVHAHSRQGRLEDDVARDERTRAQPGEPVEAGPVGDGQDHDHEKERNEKLRDERDPGAARPRDRGRVTHGRMREPRVERSCADTDSNDCADELGGQVEERVRLRVRRAEGERAAGGFYPWQLGDKGRAERQRARRDRPHVGREGSAFRARVSPRAARWRETNSRRVRCREPCQKPWSDQRVGAYEIPAPRGCARRAPRP
jgi:hypothetical protein